jgi:translation initiation factor IF-3
MARGLDLDLVEVAPMANPPVCRIMDYGKFRYEEAQKAKEARKKTVHVSIKEVKFRPKIGKGDFDTKVRHLIEFLEEGHKVKVTLQFRGREMAHPELGQRILDEVIAAAGPIAKLENQARMEGRNMSLVMAPDKKAQDALKKAASTAAKESINGSGAEPSGDADTAPSADELVAELDDTESTETESTETQPTDDPAASGVVDDAEADSAEAPPETSGDE